MSHAPALAAATALFAACSSGQGNGYLSGVGSDDASASSSSSSGSGASSGSGGADGGQGTPHDGGNGSSGSSGSGGSSSGSDAATTGDGAGSPPSSFSVAKGYAGSYAAQVKFRKVITLSGGAGTFNALAAFYLTMQLTADTAKQQVDVAARDCHVDLTGTGTVGLMGATLQIQDNVFPMMTLDSAIFSASTTSWSMTPIQGPMGWKWASASDSLPTTSSDSRVFDQDGDGHPGITLHVFWQGTDYPLYVVMTQNESLSGTVASGGALTGTTVDTTSMNVIGNTTVLLGATVSWAPDSNTADNVVKIVKTSSLLTCAQLASQTATLFP